MFQSEYYPLSCAILTCMSVTGDAIRRSFLKLYRDVSFEKMTVKMLSEAVPVARTTFYEYYGSLADVRNEIEDELIGGILELADTCRKEGADIFTFFMRTLDYVMEHKEENFIFLVSRPNPEYISKWKKAIGKHFSSYCPAKENTANYGLILEVVASAVIGAYTYWMEHPDEVDVRQLADISLRMLSAVEQSI